MALSKKWQLTPLEYKIDFLIVPVLFAAAVWLAPLSLFQMIFGALSWSFAEYAVHRFSFHRGFRRDHWAHHVNPTAYIGISGIYIGIAYALLLIPAWWLDLESLYAGFMLGYFIYLAVHYAIHRPAYALRPIVRTLALNHEMHHRRGIEKNFGVTSPLWDFVFLTYVRPVPKQQGRASTQV